jgi:hypothetical protein
MTPVNASSLGRAGGLLRRYPGGTENRSIFATVFGSMPNSRAARRWPAGQCPIGANFTLGSGHRRVILRADAGRIRPRFALARDGRRGL